MKKQKKIQSKSKKRTQNKLGLSYVEGLKDLKKLLSEGYYEYRLQLGNGILYSKKTIYYHPETKKYQIFNWT